ncbi:MAG: hypothetical protein GY756_20375, partial [bacterium]|nr:hypothetical protein [bacterium]
NKNFSQEIKENYELGRDALLRNVATALQELIYFSGAKRFILETSPKKKRKNPKKALRSHERETYTMLLPSEIREKMGIDQVKSGTKVTPHERRRHLRVLRAESWGDRQGDVVNVKASWVGKSENIVGKKIYKVRLDI